MSTCASVFQNPEKELFEEIVNNLLLSDQNGRSKRRFNFLFYLVGAKLLSKSASSVNEPHLSDINHSFSKIK